MRAIERLDLVKAFPGGSLIAGLIAVLGGQLQAELVDVTQPGDPIVATSNNSPGSDGVANAIDNQPTKYRNFDILNAGFTVTPNSGTTIVVGLTLTSGNDGAERDPASYTLEGSNDGTNLGFRHFRRGSISIRFCSQSTPTHFDPTD